MKLRSILSSAALTAAVMVLAFGAGTASAAGMTGPYISGEGSCDFGRIIASPPQISASVQSYSSGTTFVVGGSQTIAFRAHLAKWTGSKWVEVAVGSWKRKDVALQGDPSINWYYDLTTRTWGTGGTHFQINQAGYYKVYFDLYWYANQYVSSGSLTVWASAHRELRTNAYDLGAYEYCRY